ncbi:MAG: Fe-S cluster assembly protein NifU [Planctomycetes bacterium]|jgi:NifU-like protein|nr:Fe-S cluster assembly protein NifU [Planctomycetota bacterium]MCL4731742.1 Fe-S cluster assembly protein NifU [Planctomycetota bacterium]
MTTVTDKVRDHFINPRNVGEMADATVVGEVGSLASGQALKLYLKIGADERIEAASFKVFGSPQAIAASSALTEMLKGKPVDDAARITADDIAAYLGGLPPEKMHACVIAMEALEAAYARFRGIALDNEGEEDLHHSVCRCYSVPEHKIERAIRDHNLTHVYQVTHYTTAGGGCGSCHVDIMQIIDRVRAEMAPAKPATRPAPALAGATGNVSNLQKMQLIQEVLDREIRPGLAMDGGDMELVDVQGNQVFVRLHGHCNSCSSSSATMKFFVQDRLREMVDPNLEVIDTTEHSAELHAPPMR